jgi:hypothetical protein
VEVRSTFHGHADRLVLVYPGGNTSLLHCQDIGIMAEWKSSVCVVHRHWFLLRYQIAEYTHEFTLISHPQPP